MMRYSIIALMFIALLSAALMPANANAADSSPILNVVLSDQSPYPVNPGETVSIEIQIENIGFIEATDKAVEIIPNDPFTLLPGEERVNTLTTIPGMGSRSITYRLSVDGSAPTNTYPLQFRVYDGLGSDSYEEYSVDIFVMGEASLIVDELITVPQVLEPGAVADIIAKVKNIGTGSANDVQLSINSSYEELKPILAKGSVYIDDIAPGETKTAILGMSIDSTAEEKTYTIAITASFKDDSNTASSNTFSVGLPVKGTINLDIIKKEANFERGTLRIEVANKGTAEAKSLEAKLVISNKTIGIDYISSLKANKKTTFEFPLVLRGSGSLVMDFIGPGIEKNQASREVVLDYQAPSQGDGTSIIVIIIIVVVVGYFLYRKFLKKKHHKKD